MSVLFFLISREIKYSLTHIKNYIELACWVFLYLCCIPIGMDTLQIEVNLVLWATCAFTSIMSVLAALIGLIRKTTYSPADELFVLLSPIDERCIFLYGLYKRYSKAIKLFLAVIPILIIYLITLTDLGTAKILFIVVLFILEMLTAVSMCGFAYDFFSRKTAFLAIGFLFVLYAVINYFFLIRGYLNLVAILFAAVACFLINGIILSFTQNNKLQKVSIKKTEKIGKKKEEKKIKENLEFRHSGIWSIYDYQKIKRKNKQTPIWGKIKYVVFVGICCLILFGAMQTTMEDGSPIEHKWIVVIVAMFFGIILNMSFDNFEEDLKITFLKQLPFSFEKKILMMLNEGIILNIMMVLVATAIGILFTDLNLLDGAALILLYVGFAFNIAASSCFMIRFNLTKDSLAYQYGSIWLSLVLILPSLAIYIISACFSYNIAVWLTTVAFLLTFLVQMRFLKLLYQKD